MINPTTAARGRLRLHFVLGAVVAMLLSAPSMANAQVVEGVQKGAREGNKAAGPVGGVLGGAIGGVVGVFTGVLGTGNNTSPPPAKDKQGSAAKSEKGAKAKKGTKQNAVLTQDGAPQLTAEQIVANSDANI
ncbi:MAG TPA: hypothetical protein VD863_08270, partial [Bradyrhizobium sp.]|nr:hypothetical protein [Bradyrhizobium sp.]